MNFQYHLYHYLFFIMPFCSFSSCCWMTLVYGGSKWHVSSTVNLTQRSDTGNINSSPVSASSPIVRLQQGCPTVITIPTEDPDGDKVRCRWSTECGGVCKAFSYGKLDEVSAVRNVGLYQCLGFIALIDRVSLFCHITNTLLEFKKIL